MRPCRKVIESPFSMAEYTLKYAGVSSFIKWDLEDAIWNAVSRQVPGFFIEESIIEKR